MRKMEIACLIACQSTIACQWFSNILNPYGFQLHDIFTTLFAEEAIVKVSMITNISTISIIYLKILYIILYIIFIF